MGYNNVPGGSGGIGCLVVAGDAELYPVAKLYSETNRKFKDNKTRPEPGDNLQVGCKKSIMWTDEFLAILLLKYSYTYILYRIFQRETSEIK